ncbi:EXTL2, alpha-1,4-N-acetylhexosaminyltransferase [Ancylostoma ceylanicum]|uniref:EXTL2, alpha-1,4-N-acetylhexosaminyltransferase n=1 Tax=Ancylostoma ceylanicum TaxID=53326 RepID=A0A0D6LK57_9BILA|nr:EXTL2, alpha-1,4-N-acetylhexosaminyltransferase [Ancylostoma ceylanicum]
MEDVSDGYASSKVCSYVPEILPAHELTQMRSLLPLNYGYRQQEKCGRNPLSFALEKLLRLFSVRNVAFVMFLCIYTLFVLLLRGGFPLDDFPFRSQKSKVLIRDIHDDYDVGCNGYSMDFRIAEQQRILRSVRSELIDSSAKLQEVNIVYEDLTKKIPEKQLELTAVLDEIESARRTLKELQDRKNFVIIDSPLNSSSMLPDSGRNTVIFLLFVFVASDAEEIAPYSLSDLSRLNTSAMLSGDNIEMLNCSSSVGSSYCGGEGEIDHIDWRLASIRFHPARFPELHFIIRSLEMAEVLELRRMGRFFFERYLGDNRAVVRALLASLREKLEIPSPPEALAKAVPLFNNSFTAPILTPINVPPLDDEYLGPLEGAVDSASYLHNFSSLSMYSYHSWNVIGQPGISFEFLAQSVDPPTESEFYPDSNIVVLLTYNRDAVLATSLERLHRLPYLNKVIVVWNNIAREPMGAWPRLHVPVEFIKVTTNSLNNRFVPWDRITTEAVLSLDDDIDLKQHEIVFAFRVWRENRHRIVGFPARHHARYDDQMYYNSNHTCQLSIILTGAAFLHKSYLHAYTHQMPEAIRRHVDDVMNCEDIAMNFLVSHITREPPIKTTSKWTLRCPTCAETLSQDESHFHERHECIRLFTRIYGYNPLKFSQFRADSVLFKTRLPPDKQKCFRFV